MWVKGSLVVTCSPAKAGAIFRLRAAFHGARCRMGTSLGVGRDSAPVTCSTERPDAPSAPRTNEGRLRRHPKAWAFLLVLAAIVASSVALAATPVTVTVKVAHNASLHASILVTRDGMTLYHLVPEHGTKVACTGACASTWSPLLVPSGVEPSAGKGIAKSKLGTITRPDGRRQVTYGGFALYRYFGDRKAGDADGQGLQDVWYAVSASGRVVKSIGRRHVLLISVDGLHASDLAMYVASHADSTLARLT